MLSGTALSHAKLFLAISQCQRTFSIFIYLFNVYWKTYFLANLTENESKSTRLKKGIELLSVHSSFRETGWFFNLYTAQASEALNGHCVLL